MLNRPELRGIALSPGLDRRKLSLNGFVAYGRVEVLRAFFQAAQEVVGRRLAVARLTMKTTHESITGDSRGRSPVTRRQAMNLFASTAAAAALPAAAIASDAASEDPDPIFAAIDAHKAAQAAEDKITSVTCKMVHIPDDLELQVAAAHDVEADAFHDLFQTAPTTAPGRDAWLAYLAEYTDKLGAEFYMDGAMFTAFLETIQESVAA
jgi:hypothetical protein